MATLDRTDTLDLSTLAPGSVTADTRASYAGWLVDKSKLVEVATALRDQHGFDCSHPPGGLLPDTGWLPRTDDRRTGHVFVQVPRRIPPRSCRSRRSGRAASSRNVRSGICMASVSPPP
jgi:hypothetical protein